MRKGTTPTHNFMLPFPTDMVEEVEITYCQNGEEVLKKRTADAELSDSTVSVTLTQEETFSFVDDQDVHVQVRVLTNEKDVLASNIMRITCERCLSCEVLE